MFWDLAPSVFALTTLALWTFAKHCRGCGRIALIELSLHWAVKKGDWQHRQHVKFYKKAKEAGLAIPEDRIRSEGTARRKYSCMDVSCSCINHLNDREFVDALR